METKTIIKNLPKGRQEKIAQRTQELVDEFKKSDGGKAPLHHLGDYRIGLEAMCRVAEYGAQKYGRNNWHQCNDTARYEAALMRHALKALSGERVDPDHGQSHWAAVAWNAMCLMHLQGTLNNDNRVK